jgi:hypothetical protein
VGEVWAVIGGRRQMKLYHILPVMIYSSDVSLFPLLQVKNIHAKCPATSILIEILRDLWVREVEILVKPMEALLACLHSTIYHPSQINGPKRSEILLNYDIIIQK